VQRRLEFRQSGGRRAGQAVLVGAWLGLLVAKMFPDGGAGLWIGAGVAAPLWGLWLWRMLGMAVIADGDELILRNLWWTTRVRRSQIEEFRVGRASGRLAARTVQVVTATKTFTTDMFWLGNLAGSGRQWRDDAVTRLNRWLDS